MASIRCIRLENHRAGPPAYAVELTNGATITGLRRGDLASCRAFELATALAGHHVRIDDELQRELNDLPATWRRELWLRMVAQGIAAGREEAPVDVQGNQAAARLAGAGAVDAERRAPGRA